jgi:hypothetical protein
MPASQSTHESPCWFVPATSRQTTCRPGCEKLPLVNRVALRNTAIVLALAAIGVVWQRGASGLEVGFSQIISVLFVASLAGFAIQYFRERQLAWLVMRPWQRGAVIACSSAAALLATLGFWFLGDVLTPLGVFALIVICVLVVVWIVRESQRYR